MKKIEFSFGFEQTFTIPDWWSEPGFCSQSDTPKKREMMLALAEKISEKSMGRYIKSKDIWDHMQYETFDKNDSPLFEVTMDPGSIEVKTPPLVLGKVEKFCSILFEAASEVGLVPYRNWWYGIKGGTEGGCHINFGGFTKDTNPLVNNPKIIFNYISYMHNRPWLSYPFMGVDIGPGGNAQRLDEKSDYEKVKNIYNSSSVNEPDDLYKLFKDTSLYTDKSSYPSLAKFKAPLYLIEDRAQEALRSSHELFLVSNLRFKILDHIKDKNSEIIEDRPELHEIELTSFFLWEKFQFWANNLKINPVEYQLFFDRQFPELWLGEGSPNIFGMKEGRRPRKVTATQERNGVIISRTIDTSFKRFELFSYTKDEYDSVEFKVFTDNIETQSKVNNHNGYLGFGSSGYAKYSYIDLKVNKEKPLLKIQCFINNKLEEEAYFHLTNMTWTNEKD